MKFKSKLEEIIKNFNLEKAEELSIEIHQAESEGIELTPKEDYLWQQLTVMIQQYYNK